jgi:hypothetical protein
MGFYGQKYAENYRLEVADIRKNCDCGIAELRLRSNIFLKSCGIAIAEVFPSSCGFAIADSKKSCSCPPLPVSRYQVPGASHNPSEFLSLMHFNLFLCIPDRFLHISFPFITLPSFPF